MGGGLVLGCTRNQSRHHQACLTLIKTPLGSSFIPKDLCGIAVQQRKGLLRAKVPRGGYQGMKNRCILMPKAGWGSVAFPSSCCFVILVCASQPPSRSQAEGQKHEAKGQSAAWRRWSDSKGRSAGLGTVRTAQRCREEEDSSKPQGSVCQPGKLAKR